MKNNKKYFDMLKQLHKKRHQLLERRASELEMVKGEYLFTDSYKEEDLEQLQSLGRKLRKIDVAYERIKEKLSGESKEKLNEKEREWNLIWMYAYGTNHIRLSSFVVCQNKLEQKLRGKDLFEEAFQIKKLSQKIVEDKLK